MRIERLDVLEVSWQSKDCTSSCLISFQGQYNGRAEYDLAFETHFH